MSDARPSAPPARALLCGLAADPDLARRLQFLVAVDALKRVERRTRLFDGSRHENSAEHSWHLALFALTLAPHAPAGADAARAVAMLLVHDVVEVRAGDTFAYDDAATAGQHDRESRAADELFGMLPPAQAAEFRALWDEFEAGETPTARYANALDRLQPMMQNDANAGGTWREHGVRRSAVAARAEPVAAGLPCVWQALVGMIDAHCAAGAITADDEPGRVRGAEPRGSA
jgi:putative hydrolase of HD superfamily